MPFHQAKRYVWVQREGSFHAPLFAWWMDMVNYLNLEKLLLFWKFHKFCTQRSYSSCITTFLLSLTNLMIEKVLFSCQIFENVILIDLHFMRSQNVFNVLSVCVSVCVCYQHNSKTNYSRNIKFSILLSYHIQFVSYQATWNFLWGSDKNSMYRGAQKNYNA